MSAMHAPLVLVSNNTRAALLAHGEVAADLAPRQDYVEICRRLGGTIVGYDSFGGPWQRRVQQLERRLRLDLTSSLFAAVRAPRHNLILSMSEKAAIPVAAALALTGRATPHTVIAHKLSSGLKTHLWRLGRLQRRFADVICVSRAQADYAVHELGVPAEAAHFVHDKVDQRFFRPQRAPGEDFILAVGKEQRDYETLLRAVAGTGLRLVVVASSPWATDQAEMTAGAEITVLRQIPYLRLRELYAEARLVVVPLRPVAYAAGVNALLEAMAMGKAVVASATEGLEGYVRDGETGLLVPPGDAGALREAVLTCWGDAARRRSLGEAARGAVELTMNLDLYVEQVLTILQARVG